MKSNKSVKYARCALCSWLIRDVMRHRGLLFTVIAVGLPAVASANAIIPYMAVPWGQVLLFPAVIMIEALFLWKEPITFSRAALQSFLANLASTVVGAGLYLVTMPYVGDHFFKFWFKGEVASETLRGLAIAFGFASVLGLLSWLIESAVVARLQRLQRDQVSWPLAKANLLTYGLLVLLALGLS